MYSVATPHACGLAAIFFMHVEIYSFMKYIDVSLLLVSPPCSEGMMGHTSSIVKPKAFSKGSSPFPAGSSAMFTGREERNWVCEVRKRRER